MAAKYYYNNENNEKVFIKNINFAEGKLEFTTNESEAYRGRDGYYAEPLKDQLINGFSEEYPEVKNLYLNYTYD